MTRGPNKTRDPRQRAGLTLATPRRVRVEVDATPMALLSSDDRRRTGRPLPALELQWAAQLDEAGETVAFRSSPLPLHDGPAVVAALHGLGLAADAVRIVPALCWAHVAVVAYPDDHRVVFGLSEPPRDVAHAEAAGFPFARVEGRRVRPWDGIVHGHTDAEVQAARVFVRSRTTAAAGASS